MKRLKGIINFLRSKLLLRLWGIMMVLVVAITAFLWVVQIQLFEPNYVDATISDLSTRTKDAAVELEELGPIDTSNNDNPLYYLSKSIKGKVFLVDEKGKVLFAYNRALITNETEIRSDWKYFIKGRYQKVTSGEQLGISYLNEHGDPIIIVGQPIIYKNRPAALILYNSVTELRALKELNRRQLTVVSAGLALVASLISFILARNFTRPILNIKGTVEQLAKGDFTAVPDVKRRDELGSLSCSVCQLSSELQRIDVLRKEVIANISHELRSPLALIAGYSEMVRDVTGFDENVRNRNMDLIIRETQRLSQMVDDIMDYSQLQAGYSQLKLDTYDLCELVESSVDYARDVAKEYSISIEYAACAKDIPVLVDPLKISQVLRNLLNNAINHTDNGETITVRILWDKEPEKGRVCVCNPGEPIPAEEAQLIWERYKRVQHQGGRKEGTGIGLAIVSSILNAHGLEYGVTSTNRSNCFWFTFTVNKQASP